MREAAGSSNPNPIVVTFGQAAQVSTQVTEYMLCESCEQRIAKSERYVAKLAYSAKGDRIPLDLLGVVPLGVRSARARYASAKGLDTDKLVFLAASVIWRACVAQRKDTGKPILGKTYVEEFRRYLNGEAVFPRNARLTLSILDQPKGVSFSLHNIASFPATLKRDGYHIHGFYLCGLCFELIVGNMRPSYLETMCLHHGKDKFVLILTASEIGLLRDIGRLARSAKAAGKLSR